jgi:DNA-binding PadR family transcriptional regulator
MRESIGELEELTLLVVGTLMDNAYALTIQEEINEKANRNLDITAIHSVLRRLEKKGLLNSEMRGATNERGGRRKRYFKLTHAGRAIIENTMRVKMDMYHKLPKLTFSSLN